MTLSALDWILIALYMVFTLGIALLYARKAGKSLGEFFLGGRTMPWYLAGLSMVATTFAADTPLAVTEIVAQKGISGNWLWWNMMIGGMLTVFFYASLWRRANVLTEVEFIGLRYAGKPATFLRMFKSVYLGLFMNVLIIAWVNQALISILVEIFGIQESHSFYYVGGIMAFVAIYSAVSGLIGVAVTDAFQFFIAMAGCIALAIIVVNSEQIGGIDGMKEKLNQTHPQSLNFLPSFSATSIPGMFAITAGTFLAYVGFQWWASWYPGAEPGGGGYVAQRMMGTKNEKHAVLATLFFQIAHYCLRPWPWILVALCSLILYPDLEESELKLGYVKAMNDFLPSGFKGLLLVAFFAAYMSTIATQLNWGASYIVNDFIRPMMARGNQQDAQSPQQDEEKVLVLSGRIVTAALMIFSLIVTPFITSISGVWSFMMECGAGLGLVLIMRWYWWRINVWTEIAATIAPFFFYAISFTLNHFHPVAGLSEGIEKGAYTLSDFTFMQKLSWYIGNFPGSYFFTIAGTTVTWLLVMLMTRPEPMEHLVRFYDRIRPGGAWKPVRASGNLPASEPGELLRLAVCWLLSLPMTVGFLFGIGKLVLKEWGSGFAFLGVGAATALLLVFMMGRTSVFSGKNR